MKGRYKILGIVCLFLVVAAVGGFMGNDISHEKNSYSGTPAIYQNGVVISGVDVSGLTIWEAEEKIEEVNDGYRSRY